MKDFNERSYIYILKAFALISIVCAHVSVVSKDTNLFNNTSGLILDSLGSIGVGVFLLISGYLFFNNKKSLTVFFKAKIKTIFIPWVFCGTLNFLYVALRKGGLDFFNWMLALTQHSHLYYLTVLILSYLLFWRLKNENWFLILMIVLSLISIKLTGFGILKVNPYTNPFNWSIYFSFGILIKKYNLLEKTAMISKKYFLTVSLLYLTTLAIYVYNGTYISYWAYAPIIAEIIAIAILMGLSMFFIGIKSNKILLKLGEMSFAIYLLHMPFAGMITYIFNHYNLWFLTFFRPIIVILITIVGIEIARYLFRKIHGGNIINILIGLNRNAIKKSIS